MVGFKVGSLERLIQKKYDKLANILKLKRRAAGHANQDFNFGYSYSSTNNKLTAFTVNNTFYTNIYNAMGDERISDISPLSIRIK